MKFVIYLLIIIALAVVAVAFAVHNGQLVDVNFFNRWTINRPLYLVVAGSFLAGAVIAMIPLYSRNLMLRTRIGGLNRKLKKIEQQALAATESAS